LKKKISPWQKGVACEHIATAWLIEEGYFVFSATGSHSPMDLVALDCDEEGNLINIIFVDVKAAQSYTREQALKERRKKDYERCSRSLKPFQKKLGVKLLTVYKNHTCEWYTPGKNKK